MKKRPAVFLCLLWFIVAGDFSGAGFRSVEALILNGRVRELALENPGADTLYFARPAAIGHDDENLYILDSIDSEIHVFSKSGAFRYAIGKKGQGPAEFDGPNNFSLYGGKIYVSDAGNRRIQILDIKGKYLGGFKVTSFPMKVLALDENAVVVSHLPAALPGDAAKEENLVRCFTPDGDYVWEAVRSLSNGDPVFDTMQNRHVLKACSGGFYFLRMCNDPWIRRLDRRGNISRTVRVDKKFGWKTLSIPAQKGKKLTLSGLFWDCDVSGDFLYLLVPEFSEGGDLVAGRRLAVLSDDGSLVGWLDLPVRVNKISIDGGRIYVIDTDYRLRIFQAEEK
jgi:hypothetical protein